MLTAQPLQLYQPIHIETSTRKLLIVRRTVRVFGTLFLVRGVISFVMSICAELFPYLKFWN